jgi:predicted dehydrogenase
MIRTKKRYAIVGLGSRSSMFWQAISTTYKDIAEIAGFCDTNRTRMEFALESLRAECGYEGEIPCYNASNFDCMVRETRPDTVIVTSIDRTHHQYIVRAMELGCDVITEKPMTIDATKCQAILDAVKKTGKSLRVTFNYRYAPSRSKVKELIRSGIIGEVRQVHFEWLLDTKHGADYFRRWHRDKRNSGGLMVHKATHHFDLVNWWLDTTPELVFALGSLAFYGRDNAEARGEDRPYFRTTGVEAAKDDPFALNLAENQNLKSLYLNAEHEDGYLRDRNVFDDGISIEDTMNVLVRYANGAQMSYSLVAYAPWEGYRVMFNGTKGRIELQDVEESYVSDASGQMGRSLGKGKHILVCPHFAEPYEVKPPTPVGGHGGGDTPLLESIFSPATGDDPLGLVANHVDGAWSILTGISANQSFATARPVRPADLIRF